MADDGDWFADTGDDLPPPELKPLGSKRTSLADPPAAAAAPAADATGAPAESKEDRPVAEDEFLDPDKLMLCKHWIRYKIKKGKIAKEYY